MKFIRTTLAFLLVAGLAPQLATAQKIKLVKGDIKAFAGIDTLNTEFTYDNLEVGKEGNEENYIERKKAEYNKKEAGKGDAWAKAWKDDRAFRYEPKFNELFTKHFEHPAGSYKRAKYTLVVHTSFIEPGFNVGITRKSAKIDTQIWLVETAGDHKEAIVKFTVEDAPGGDAMGFDFDSGLRISEAYAITGKALAKYINKKI
ncbi:hypothetical protein [uncultured Chitinophaga sp.]|uniref:hypothetical protein n=1 Tax=uncultured Chitinophaga sp. TaxID=339340 RepID=UPI0025E05DDF|nr:hypothetical protein [uncultured Chitinophaga sp.]